MILISLVLSFEFYCISIYFHCISTIISIVFPLYFHCISIVFYPFLLVHDHDLQCATSLIYPEAQFQGETILDAAKRFIKLPHFEEEILRKKLGRNPKSHRKKSRKIREKQYWMQQNISSKLHIFFIFEPMIISKLTFVLFMRYMVGIL